MNQKEKIFKQWKENTSSRIENWKKGLIDKEEELVLDFSESSLSSLENHIISKYSLVDLKNKEKNNELDGIVSYMGETLIRLIPESKWIIYTEDKTNVYYNLPCVYTKYSGSISVHFLLREILNAKTFDIIETRLKAVLKCDEEIRKHLKEN
ncbi:hypothetical protein [Cellulophaga lytica]|uniref:DUF3806 domain-containing protein n=1 Tax=Cellulophaga lytica (strain ATCC 23178 / DSM 7489 / JCM 8516 / NBRC 14961 / NCIMB 1423 / VKM B-1433 / Cy l20) TaxID=867900 RepID=F0RGX9_CELLC|nr:hypothetical protein [Cellulophaga lytica]ADY30183.1 hypothetical protein Celly_2365 [Cellulophaga lytica DSM 7489]WQG78881.1 hypothetical protein SR888_08115 [Cellulophaga lytica]